MGLDPVEAGLARTAGAGRRPPVRRLSKRGPKAVLALGVHQYEELPVFRFEWVGHGAPLNKTRPWRCGHEGAHYARTPAAGYSASQFVIEVNENLIVCAALPAPGGFQYTGAQPGANVN